MPKELVFRSDVDVQLVSHMGEDLDIARSAWVSTKGDRAEDEQDTARVSGLINYLMRDRHGSPFEQCTMRFLVTAPIFVWREHMRHRIASYNEESGRYKELDPVFYIPSPDRKLVQVGKTGHYEFVDGTPEQYVSVENSMVTSSVRSYDAYQHMLEQGVAREVARMILPVNTYSSAYVTMNLRALMNFLSLRQNVEGQKVPSFPQREIEMVAEKYEQLFKDTFPLTYAAFVNNGRVAP